MASGEPFTKQYQAVAGVFTAGTGLGLTAPELEAGETGGRRKGRKRRKRRKGGGEGGGRGGRGGEEMEG